MHRITIQYAIPEDRSAFDDHYFQHHVPLVMPLPGLQSFTWSKPRPLGGDPTVYLVAELDFADGDAAKAALRSPEMAAAAADAASLGVAATMFTGEVVSAHS